MRVEVADTRDERAPVTAGTTASGDDETAGAAAWCWSRPSPSLGLGPARGRAGQDRVGGVRGCEARGGRASAGLRRMTGHTREPGP